MSRRSATPAATHAHVGRGPCGCIRCAVIDRPGDEAAVRLAVSRFCAGGYRMERVPIEVARAGPYGCEACQRKFPPETLPPDIAPEGEAAALAEGAAEYRRRAESEGQQRLFGGGGDDD